MKTYIIIFLGFLSSCKAQNSLSATIQKDSLQYYSDICNHYTNYTRTYLNDSVYIEQHGDAADTVMVKGNKLFKLHRGSIYKIIDADEDFIKNNKQYRHYFYGLTAYDTLQRTGESKVQYELRLNKSMILFMPVKKITIDSRDVYIYYLVGDCFPVTSEKCIQSKIVNGQYTVLYFEKDMGYTGYAAGDSKCEFLLTDKSYKKLLDRKKE